MKKPDAIVPPDSKAAQNVFNFMRRTVETGGDYEVSLERAVETESPPGRLVPRIETSTSIPSEASQRRAKRREHHRGLPTGDLD